MNIFARCILAALFFSGAGCGQQTYSLQEPVAGGIELVDTPFFVQEDLQCGPASLAALLGAAGVDVHPDTLRPQLFLPEQQGTLQVEMMAAVRRYGRIPFLIAPEMDAITDQLRADRPVLILQNLGLRWYPVYHYAVVVGSLVNEKVVLRSGSSRRLVMDASRFRQSWQRAGGWGLVALRPGELPAGVDPQYYLSEVAILERLGQWEQAEIGYRAVLEVFPDHPVALFGLANVFLHQNSVDNAVSLYQKILSIDAERGEVYNNLADALLRRGDRKQALQAVEKGLALPNQPPAVMSILQETRLEIAQ